MAVAHCRHIYQPSSGYSIEIWPDHRDGISSRTGGAACEAVKARPPIYYRKTAHHPLAVVVMLMPYHAISAIAYKNKIYGNIASPFIL